MGENHVEDYEKLQTVTLYIFNCIKYLQSSCSPGKLNLVRMQRFIVYIKQYVCNKLFVNRRFWKMHSTDLSKVPHRYVVMLTIHTQLVHPHPFVVERAAMFYNRVCHFRTKPRRCPCRIKNSDRHADSASIIRRASKISGRYRRDFINKKLRFPDSAEIP